MLNEQESRFYGLIKIVNEKFAAMSQDEFDKRLMSAKTNQHSTAIREMQDMLIWESRGRDKNV